MIRLLGVARSARIPHMPRMRERPLRLRITGLASNSTCRHRSDGGKTLRSEARCLRQPCGDIRPRGLYLTLPASIVVHALPEPPVYGQGCELAFRVGAALPIVPLNHVAFRPDCGKHPGFDALRRRAQDNPWRTSMLTEPVENHRSQGVGGSIRRRAGLFTRQVTAWRISNRNYSPKFLTASPARAI